MRIRGYSSSLLLSAIIALVACSPGAIGTPLESKGVDDAPGDGTGLSGQYFAGKNFETLVLTRLDPTVDFTWTGSPSTEVPSDGFSVRWTGKLLPRYSEVFRFSTISDDGIRVWVNGEAVIDNWTNHSATEDSGTIALTAGEMVEVKVEYFDNTHGARVALLWESASQPKQIVPTAQLFPSSIPILPDTTPPEISAVAAGSLTSSGATITWTTNEASNTQVEYGPTTAYGSSTTLNGSLVTSHQQALTGLAASTTYNYRVKSRDTAGNLATSGNRTFVTSACTTNCPFVHPGVVLNRAQLDFVKAKLAAGAEPWKSALAKMQSSYLANLSRVPKPVPEVRCAASTGRNYIAAHPELGLTEAGCADQIDDATSAYVHALLWYYTGNRANAQKAIEFMNAWSGTLTAILFDQPRTDASWSPPNLQIFANGQHQSAWAGQIIVRAAEIIRHTFTAQSGETAFDATRFESMLRNVYLPHTQVGGAARGNWNGWGVNVVHSLANATIGIGVFLDDHAVFNAGLNDLRGQIPAAIYLVGDDTSAYVNLAGLPLPPPGTVYDKPNVSAATVRSLWQNPTKFISGLQGETCRDVSHMVMGFESMAYAAETARIQGVDLYGELETRFITALELNASYINAFLDGDGEPPPPSNWVCASALNEGGSAYKLGWEIAYNHYAQRGGKSLPEVAALIERFRPTGTGLHINWETLTHAGTP